LPGIVISFVVGLLNCGLGSQTTNKTYTKHKLRHTSGMFMRFELFTAKGPGHKKY